MFQGYTSLTTLTDSRQSITAIVPVRLHSYIVAVYATTNSQLPGFNYNIPHSFILATVFPFVLSLDSEPGRAGLTIVIPASDGKSRLVNLIYLPAKSNATFSIASLVAVIPPLLDCLRDGGQITFLSCARFFRYLSPL